MTAPLTHERRFHAVDGFVIAKHVSDERWRWTWLGASIHAAVRVEGLSAYKTKAACVRGAKAARKRIVKYCKDLT